MNKHITKALSTQMDRKEFLRHLGVAIVALTGATSVISALKVNHITSSSQSSAGYGRSSYGN